MGVIGDGVEGVPMEALRDTTGSGAGAIEPVFDPCQAPVVVVEISSLTPGDTPRLSAINAEHALLLSGIEEPLPPIIVQRAGMRVIDGMHRVRAAMLRGDTTIRSQLFDGTDDAAFLLAVLSNAAHGLPLTLTERKTAAQRILTANPGWSDRAVAVHTGLSDKTVASVRRRASAEIPQLTARFGADRRLRPLDVDHRRRLAADLIVAHPETPIREIAAAAGIAIGTVRDVRARLGRGEDPVPTRRRRGESGPAEAVRRVATDRSRPGGFGVRDPQQRLATLERLRADPSLRFSLSGRNAVRWLYAWMSGPDQWDELVRAIPPHWAEVVADLARGCADSWNEFADACENRASRVG